MDYVDAPYTSQKRKSKNTFQYELDQKMKERRAKGLTTDITSEESEGIADDGGDSEEESMLMEYRQRLTQRKDRPTSAKRRSEQPSLGETLRASDANKWLKSSKSKTQQENIPPVRGASPYESPRFSTQKDLDAMFGSNKPHRGSPKEENIFSKSRTSPVDKDLYGKHRSSPEQSGTSFPKGKPGDRKSPLTKEPSKEELIFGRKTPTKEQMKEAKEKKEWQAPSYRKQSPLMDQDRSPSPAGSRGRKTPVDQSLASISEGSPPVPKPRGGQTASPKDFKLRSKETSPRSGISLESTIRAEPRTRPKVDIFGKKEAEVSFDDDEKPQTSARDRRRLPDSKTLSDPKSGRHLSGGRQTPTEDTGRKTPTDRFGRTTPPGRKTPTFTTGRQTPTDRQGRFGSRSKLEAEKEKEREGLKQKKEPGLFDFLGGEADPAVSPKHKPRVRNDKLLRQTNDQGRTSMKKSVSHDSITEELDIHEHPSMNQPLPKSKDMKKMADDSSVCEELDEDPHMRAAREKERAKTAPSGKQRSDRLQADNAIDSVADAQYARDTETTKSDRPLSAKKGKGTPQPKPRHSLPGSVASDRMDTEDMFNSTVSIRQAIYEEWRKEKMKKAKQELAEKKKKEEEAEKKREKDKKDKELESKASYNAWMQQKEDTFVKEKQKEKSKQRKEEEKKEREKTEKQKEATINFRMWKEKKDEKIIDEHKKKIEEKHRKIQEEKAEKRKKEKDNESAFNRWKSKKDTIIMENHERKQTEQQKTIKLQKQTMKQKENEATKKYYDWLEKKEAQQKKEAEMQRLKKMREEINDDYRPAWSPASKVIPYGR